MFKKHPDPTFRAIATIADAGLIDFEFRAMGRNKFKALMRSVSDGQRSESEALAELIAGWDESHPDSLVTVPFAADVLEALLDEYWSSGTDIVSAYAQGRVAAKKPT